MYGRGDRTRTCGLMVPNHAPYQTGLHPDKWLQEQESNLHWRFMRPLRRPRLPPARWHPLQDLNLYLRVRTPLFYPVKLRGCMYGVPYRNRTCIHGFEVHHSIRWTKGTCGGEDGIWTQFNQLVIPIFLNLPHILLNNWCSGWDSNPHCTDFKSAFSAKLEYLSILELFTKIELVSVVYKATVLLLN